MNRRFKRGKASKNNRVRASRLVIEHLEPRQLLAGLNVWVVADQNGSRSYDEAVDSSAANRLVYVDLDRDGTLDNNEPLAVTDRDGGANFSDLLPGIYNVGVVGTNDSQVQSFPVSTQSLVPRQNASEGDHVLATHDLRKSWTITKSGLVSVLDANRRVERQFALGGSPQSIVQPIGDIAYTIVHATGTGRTSLVRLDLASGTVGEIPVLGLEAGSQLKQLTRVGEQLFIGLSSPTGSKVASVNVHADSASVGNISSIEFDSGLAGSPAGRWLATASSISTTRSQIALSDMSFGGLEESTIDFDGQLQDLHFSSNGTILLASIVGGGARVYRTVGGLQLAAVLAEAAEPISTNSIDGRMVTGNATRPNELIVWNPETWQPTGRITLDFPVGVTAPVAKAAVTDRYADRMLVATAMGTFEIDTAVPESVLVEVREGQTADVRLGVRVVGENDAPEASSRAQRILSEDSIDQSGPAALVEFVRDANGNPLWYTLDAAPRHGSLSLLPDGSWRYQPLEDYYGADQAVLHVHDGMATSSLTVSIHVTGVNDPPRGMQTDFTAIAETASGGTSLGFITVFDPDRDARYAFTSSDRRFIVIDGQLLLAAVGALDFETESSIVVDVTATDITRRDFSITKQTTLSVTDVNEPPTGIRISNARVSENRRGAVIGTVTVEDPDQVDSLVFELSDNRFEIVDGKLKLLDDIELDFETESSLALVVTATSTVDPAATVAATLTITVTDVNDPPTGLTLTANMVIARKPGYVVGTVTVLGGDIGDQYRFTVSDPRFEVVNRRLKLKQNDAVRLGDESFVRLTITATNQEGDTVSKEIELIVRENSSFHNPRNPLDVDNDGHVTPRDALLLVNFLNQYGPQYLDPDQGNGEGIFDPEAFYDVNGDGAITPIDVLIIINYLNNSANNRPSGEGERVDSVPHIATLARDSATRIVTNPLISIVQVPAIESMLVVSKLTERISSRVFESFQGPDVSSVSQFAPSRDGADQEVPPIYGPNRPGAVYVSSSRDLDSELETLLDELSVEQFGRLQDE